MRFRKTLFNESKTKWVVISLLLIIFGPIGCNHTTSQSEILVFGAASSNEAVTEICQLHLPPKPVNISLSFAGSSTLASQISTGAEADVFLSANLQWIEVLKKRGHVADVNRMLRNQLVVIASKNRDNSNWVPQKLKDLTNDRVERISIADPGSVPAGIYTKTAMNNLQIWQSIRPKLIYGTDVRQTLAHVENATVDFGIVYRTDANISSNVKVVFEIPIELTGQIEYGLVLTAHGNENPRSRNFYDFLGSADAIQVFKKHGFLVTGESE